MTAQSAPQSAIDVGDIRLTYLPDGEGHFVPTAMFPASTDAAWRAHQSLLDGDGRYVTTLGGFLVETGDRKIVVDLGIGEVDIEVPDFVHAVGGRFLDSLQQAGVAPEEVDTVIFTHLHSDHTGWTSRGPEHALTFANADHIIGSDVELTFWGENPDAAFAPDAAAVRAPLESRVQTAVEGRSVATGVDLRATPGHTPGHQSVILSSGSARAVILGDLLHCPAQLAEPEWSVLFDVDPDLARRTRERELAELEGSDVVVACSHFPDSVFGRVLPAEANRRWVIG